MRWATLVSNRTLDDNVAARAAPHDLSVIANTTQTRPLT
jgi:hypothetical protein